MERYEKYIIKNNHNLVGIASILNSARNVVEAADVMMVPLLPMEDVTVEASPSFLHQSQDCHEEPMIVEDVESSFSDQELDSDTDTSSDSDGGSYEKINVNVTDIQVGAASSRPENSPMIFAIPVDDVNAKGEKDKAKCMLCKKVMLKKSFRSHIDYAHTHTSNAYAKEKCKVCGKLMLKKSLSLHMKSFHFEEKVKCDECGVELALIGEKSHITGCNECGKELAISSPDGQKLWHKKKGRKVKANCEECGARVLKGNLKRHLRNVHGIVSLQQEM